MLRDYGTRQLVYESVDVWVKAHFSFKNNVQGIYRFGHAGMVRQRYMDKSVLTAGKCTTLTTQDQRMV